MGTRAKSIAARGAASTPGRGSTSGACRGSLIHGTRVPRKHNTDFAAVETETIHFRASFLGILFFGETDKPETTATTGSAVERGVNVSYFPKLCENSSKFIRASFIAEVVDFDRK
jgi:hypothetical protein